MCPIIHLLRATDIIAEQLMEGNQKKNWSSLKLVQGSRTCTLQIIPKTRDEERLPGILRTAGYISDAQTWTLRRRKKKLRSCQQKMERRKLQVVRNDRVTNAEMRKTTNMKDIVAVAHNLKWKWGGHVAGTEQRRWTHATSMWDLKLGKRRSGRPKTRSRQ